MKSFKDTQDEVIKRFTDLNLAELVREAMIAGYQYAMDELTVKKEAVELLLKEKRKGNKNGK